MQNQFLCPKDDLKFNQLFFSPSKTSDANDVSCVPCSLFLFVIDARKVLLLWEIRRNNVSWLFFLYKVMFPRKLVRSTVNSGKDVCALTEPPFSRRAITVKRASVVKLGTETKAHHLL